MEPGEAAIVGAEAASLALPGGPAKSPSASEFLNDEEATSTCPLLTPSPPPTDEIMLANVGDGQYSPENETTAFSLADDPNDEITHFQSPLEGLTGAKFSAGAQRQSVQSEVSDSSGSSGREPTACVQLLGPHHHYQHVYMTTTTDNNGDFQENGGTVNLPLSFDHYSSVGDYFFSTWNWPLIRQLSSFFVAAALIGAFGVAVTMIVHLPQACDPAHSWWSSATVYEIFPASFKDSKKDGMGDLGGVASLESINYLRSLGVGGVRLNSIFASPHYPEDYYNAESLTEVDLRLGSVEDVRTLAKRLHANNISLILDLPVHIVKYNNSPDYIDPVVNALEFWSSYEVDGFYFIGLDNESVQPHLTERLQNWRHSVAKRNCLFVAPPIVGVEKLVDLVHVSLDLAHGGPLRPTVGSALELWSQKILWSVGHSGNNLRLADRLKSNNNTVAVLLVLMTLPGTPSILYGDEIGLKSLHDPDNDHAELQHLRQLPPMPWAYSSLSKFSDQNILPWMPNGESLLKNADAQLAQAAIAKMAVLRKYSPQMYMTNLTIGQPKGSKNFVIKFENEESGVIAVQRWYQRRHKIVTIANLGTESASADLSSYYYGGRVLIAYPHTHMQGLDITMRHLRLQAGEVLVMQVDK